MGRSGVECSVWQWENPIGCLGLRLLTSSIFQVGLWGGSMGRASFVVKTFVVLVCGKIQLHQRNGGATLA